MSFSFCKEFFVHNLGRVEYHGCPACGFTLSDTHARMSETDWTELNVRYHAGYQGTENNPDDPRWLGRLRTQAAVINDSCRAGLLDSRGPWLDYACGDGKLSDILAGHGWELLKYDRYMPSRQGFLPDAALQDNRYSFVITTSVFEHFTRREQFDQVAALVAPDGVLGLHTVVCETVPRDPDWFYLLPVHASFHTNRSMGRLFSDWGYRASVYNVQARLWLMYKTLPADFPERLERARHLSVGTEYVFRDGFVDYWK